MSKVLHIAQQLRPFLDRHPPIRALAKGADIKLARLQHSVAEWLPVVIRPDPRQLTIAITAHCNLRCHGCRYGRDFMAGHQLSFDTVRHALDDAKAGGIGTVRFYGGEPLLHPELPRMVEHAVKVGLRPYITSNGTHLKSKIDGLYAAGLRFASIGFYGVGDDYDSYTQRSNHFTRLEQSLATVRERYGDSFELQLNYVVMRPSCTPEAWEGAWAFAKRFDMYFHLDLVGYSIPFFDQDPDSEVQFRPEDRPQLDRMVEAFLTWKAAEPKRFLHSVEFIRSVPDWVLKGAAMRVPCDAYQLLWIGADGTVQLCDTAFKLGNVNEQRLRDILFTDAHRQAARDGFQLNCPNCTCKVDSRIQKHRPSVRRYGEA